MKVRMGESKFGAPKGTYLGKFLGVKAMADDGKPRLGRDGKPMPPGMEWVWEITDDPDNDGAYVGQQVGRITSQNPTAGNACGQLLAGVINRAPSKDEEIELDAYEGKLYRITVGAQKDNPERTQVIMVTLVKTGGSSRSPTPGPAAPLARPSGPPPRRPLASAVPAKFWVERSTDGPDLLAPHEIQAWLAETKLEPSTVAACADGATGDDAWKTLSDFGFKAEPPF